MVKRKICIITDQHLVNNPRVYKEAKFLDEEGYDVSILTLWTSTELARQDQALLSGTKIAYKAVVNLTSPNILNILYRIRTRIAIEFKRTFDLETIWIFVYAYYPYIKNALKENADLYICHNEAAFFIGSQLIKRKKKVAFDFEDWYSEDYLSNTRPTKLLKKLEKIALEQGGFSFCPSEAMAEGIKTQYNTDKDLIPVYNGFPIKEYSFIDKRTLDKEDKNKPSLFWFSQTTGPDRGIEELFKALNFVDIQLEVHLRGNIGESYKAELLSLFPFSKGHKLFFHKRVSPDELLSRIVEHDIGLALEKNTPANKNLTISNKILQYLQAGIKVIASATQGQQEVASRFPNAVKIINLYDPEIFGQQIIALILEEHDREDTRAIYNKFFSWDAQIPKIKEVLKRTLN